MCAGARAQQQRPARWHGPEHSSSDPCMCAGQGAAAAAVLRAGEARWSQVRGVGMDGEGQEN